MNFWCIVVWLFDSSVVNYYVVNASLHISCLNTHTFKPWRGNNHGIVDISSLLVTMLKKYFYNSSCRCHHGMLNLFSKTVSVLYRYQIPKKTWHFDVHLVFRFIRVYVHVLLHQVFIFAHGCRGTCESVC